MTDETVTNTAWTDRLKPASLQEEAKNIQRYFNLDVWHYLIIIGIAASGLAAFISTYDAITNINKSIKACMQSGSLKTQLNTQFIVLLILSFFSIVLGLILMWFFRRQDNQRRLLTLGIMTTGVLGILYAFSMKFQTASNTIKLIASWVVFIIFLLLGWFLSTKKNVTLAKPIQWE